MKSASSSTRGPSAPPGPKTAVGLAAVGQGAPEIALYEAVRRAAEAATDFSWLSQGDAVLLKPAANSGNPYPATTSPAAVAAMTALLKEKGAGRVVVADMSGIEHVKLTPERMKGSTRRLMKESGIAKAAVAAGAELHFPEEDGWGAFFEDGPVSGSSWRAGIMMPDIIKQVDHVVLLPRCSRHALSGATLGLKAAVGYWRTDTRLEYHHDADTFHAKTAEGNTASSLLARQRLVLTVADKVLATFGPDRGNVATPDTGLVFASESVVAHDMVSLAWLVEARKTVPPSFKSGFKDPYRRGLFVNLGNRWVVSLLGGLSKAFSADPLERNDLAAVWDDRVLARAFEVFGGVPQVDLVQADDNLPAEVKRRLNNAIAVPTAG